MSLTRDEIEHIVFGREQRRRFTQDSPVLPDVWMDFNPFVEERPSSGLPDEHVSRSLLLTPARDSNPGELCEWVLKRLRAERETQYWQIRKLKTPNQLTYNESTVVVTLRFDELVRILLPLTGWWRDRIEDVPNRKHPRSFELADLMNPNKHSEIALQIEMGTKNQQTADLLWMIRIVGRIQWEYQLIEAARQGDGRSIKRTLAKRPTSLKIVEACSVLLDDIDLKARPDYPLLWAINRDRPVSMAVWRSVNATKADAATRLFDLHCAHLRWAIVDSGIDAEHPAFRQRVLDKGTGQLVAVPNPFDHDGARLNMTRVYATYDFTRLRTLMSVEVDEEGPTPAVEPGNQAPTERKDAINSQPMEAPSAGTKKDAGGKSGHVALGALAADELQRVQDMKRGLQSGRILDWSALLPLLRVEHDTTKYDPPTNDHGTHVAGILAGDWRQTDTPGSPNRHDLRGVCPDLSLLDLRVLDDNGEGDEFGVLSALQFIRWLNANKDSPVIHGVNISMSLLHDVANYACGRTPVCDECERLVGSGVVVVAAAGNEGYARFNTARGPKDGYRSISITDPGNAEGVITVGSTHRFKPHTYGVSYFSSRGPTGDGRAKPDLVAPGEKIESVVPGVSAKPLDGTSMAAPHVSGAAALLMARHGELIGQPMRIKQILCRSDTDLGREPFFQGAGMVDVLRALQSV